MIVLNTNVVSEALKPRPDAAVMSWLNQQRSDALYLTAVSASELLYGIALLDEGRRKHTMAQAAQALIIECFEARMLSFDKECAVTYATLMSQARCAGRTIDISDGQIAAIAKRHGFVVATRDRGPFEAAGVSVMDPWRG